MLDNPFDKNNYPYCHSGHQYALDVVGGKILSCKYILGACERYLKDLKEKKFPFDADSAEKFLRLGQKFHHIKGEWNTPNVVFSPWQNFIFMNIFGFTDPRTGYRRFRTAHIEVPRGSGKSCLASIVALYFLCLDNPKGNEISCFATKSDQSRIVLDTARAMARKNPSFIKSTGAKVMAHSIVHEKSNSLIRARSSDHGSLDGLNDVLSIIDELHAVSRELFDVVVSGMKKRKDSLLLCITTAGFNTDGVGHDQSVYARRVATREIQDNSFFSAVYTIDDGDDIYDRNSWMKAVPNLGISVDEIAFADAAKKAKEVPSDLPNFKVKMLNMWLSEAKAFFDVNKWKECGDPGLRIEDFKGKKCKVGVDLASKIDLTTLAYVFREDDIYYVFDKSYIPEKTAKDVRSALYDSCIERGHLIATKGEAIHYPNIAQDLIDTIPQFQILDVLYDPWSATEFAQKVSTERLNLVEFRMNTSNLSEPTKRLDALIRQGKIRHNGSELLSWAIGNVVCKEDAAGNVFPRKTHERLKIDPAIAILMALASWLQQEEIGSVYESQGIRTI